MIAWKKIEAGQYESENGRFEIYVSYDRLYGNHWILQDHNEPDYYKSLNHQETLKACKGVAETILKQENGTWPTFELKEEDL